MCIGIEYASSFKAAHNTAVTEAVDGAMQVLEKARHTVDCNNIQQYVVDLDDGSTLKMDLLPASSATCVCYMYPIDPKCLGENDEYLIPSDIIPCKAAMFDGIHNPKKYVAKPHIVPLPRYRGGGANKNETRIVQPTITLPEGACVKNVDGSISFTLKLGAIIKTDVEINAAIARGDFPDRVAYYLAIGKACSSELLRNMDKNCVDTKNLFAMREDDPTEVDPEAMIHFLEFLFLNLMPGKDIVVGIPAFDDSGRAKGAAFCLWFRYPRGVQCLPLLGLVHNIDPSDLSATHEVEGNFYIATNQQRDFKVVNEHGEASSICMHEHDFFLPTVPSEAHRSNFDDDDSGWQKACSKFQKQCQTSIWDSLETLIEKNNLPGFDKSGMFTANLKGMVLPKQTIAMASRNHSDSGTVQFHNKWKKIIFPVVMVPIACYFLKLRMYSLRQNVE